jgi:hypothetical protein
LSDSQQINLYIALIHHPVVDKNGETIASAVTNLDLHDIARTGKTYGVKAFYVVTPLADQQILVERIIDHWLCGAGSRYNPKRRQALELVKIAESLAAAIADIRNRTGQEPKTIATSARLAGNGMSYAQLRRQLKNGAPHLLLMGTAWGLADEIIRQVDHCLAPITGPGDYNHLSVRCATAIIIDRLLSRE